MITLKPPEEIRAIRRVGAVIAAAHRQVMQCVQPGVSTQELSEVAEQSLVSQHAEPVFKGLPGGTPFPAAASISVNSGLTGGIPGSRRLQSGDLLSVDIGGRIDGWCADAARTYPVGDVSDAHRRLMEFGRAALDCFIREAYCGRMWSEVVTVVSQSLPSDTFSILPGFYGHGIGRELHEDPQVPHRPDEISELNDFRLIPGLVFTVEPVAVQGVCAIRKSANGWTTITADERPGVHFENTIAIGPDRANVLTETDEDV